MKNETIHIGQIAIRFLLEAAETIVAREAAMTKAILSGTPVGKVMDGSYEQMLA